MNRTISKAFGASLSFGFAKEGQDFSISKEDISLNKYASMYIYQPTMDNIEDFVRKYMLNELAALNQSFNVDIQLNPTAMDEKYPDYVKEATGLVVIKYLGKHLEFPFLIVDGEMAPFDVIQMDGQRVPYSRENLTKVIQGLTKAVSEKDKHGTENPYLGVDDRVNPSTTPGFLGNILRIQEHAKGTSSPAGNYVYAEAVDALLEKVANMKQLTDRDMELLTNELEKVAFTEVKCDVEAKLKEEEGEFDLNLFESMRDLQFVDANGLSHGTIVSFPEKKNNEIKTVYGVVVSDFMKFLGVAKPSDKIIITNDGRVKILDKKDKFLVLKADNKEAPFKLNTVNLDTLTEGDIFVGFKEDKATPVFVKKWTNKRGAGSLTEVTYHTCEVYGHEFSPVSINELYGAKFDEMQKDEFTKRFTEVNKLEDMPIGVISPSVNYAKRDSVVLTTDPKAKVVKVKGFIGEGLKNKEDISKMAFIEDEENIFKKVASLEKNKIKIVCKDKDRNIYDVNVDYVDSNKIAMKNFSKVYKGLPLGDLRQLLKVVGYKEMEVQEIIHKAKVAPYAMYALPENPNIEALKGAQIKNLTAEKIKNTFNNTVRPKELSAALATAVLGSMLFDVLSKQDDNIKNVAAEVGKYAEECKVLSSSFEKIAIEKESPSAMNVAKLMSMGVFFNEKVANTITEIETYPRLREFSRDILNYKEVLEKTAYDLMSLKATQKVERNEVISDSIVHGAVNQLDNIYKIAYEINNLSKE